MLALIAAVLAGALAHGEPLPPKVIERYQQMLAANPVEGTALDRLWSAFSEQGRTAELLADYAARKTFAAEMVLGHLLRKAARPADARDAYARAALLDAQSPLPRLARARLERAERQHAEAAKAFTEAVELLPDGDPRKSETFFELGTEWLAAGESARAVEAWEKTATLDPGNIELRRRLADIYVRERLPERAVAHLEHIESHGGPEQRALALQQLAGLHQARGSQDGAIHALEKALSYTAPGNWLRAELQSQLIRAHQRYHRTPELEQRWKQFAAENPRDLGAYLQLIDLYERLGDHPQQLVWLEKLTALVPKTFEYRLRLARLLVQMDQLAPAAKAYDELLASQPGNLELVLERARLDVQRDQAQAAGERVAAFVAAHPRDEAVRGKAIEFYQAHRLFALLEQQLIRDASTDSREALVALANFYFAQRRAREARQTMARLTRPDAPAHERAAALLETAEMFKAQNEVEEAVLAVRAALAAQSDLRSAWFILGELEAGRGRYSEAQHGFDRAFSLSRTPAELLEADQRLYESLRNQQKPDEADARAAAPGPARSEGSAATSAAAQGYLLGLLRGAVEEPTEERWLRVARWQMWSRNFRGALDAAERALAINPRSIAAHDFLAKLHGADPQTPASAKHLRELIRLDPANRLIYLRRIGQAELQGGRTEDALRVFAEIANANPGHLEAMHDLALAQQRAEQWTAALATLQQIYALSPPSRRRDAVSALLRIYDRLGMRQPAAEMLLAQIDAADEIKDRFAFFQELLAHCSRHALLDWLRARFDQRRKLFAEDYFTEMALGRILKAQGNKAAAFEVLADAALSAPDPAQSLPELVREAEELRKLDAAIALQSQLVRIVPQSDPAGLERLAQLQEKNLQPEDAAETWERIVAKFPRDVAALERAVEFQRKWGTPERALEWVRRIVLLDPANVRMLSARAAFAMEIGQTAEAETALQEILAHTTPEKPDAPVRFPGLKPDEANRLGAAYLSAVRQRSGRPTSEALRALRRFWADDVGGGVRGAERDFRHRAIRDLGQLLAAKGDAAAVARWIARWRQPGIAPTEKLLALYGAEASGALLDEINLLLAAAPAEPEATNAFIWLALQTGEFKRLATWLHDRRRTPAERDYFIVALESHLESEHGRIDPALFRELFPPGFRQRLWQAAQRFSQHGCFREAATLGRRVFDELTTQRAAFAVELAGWHVNLGEINQAREILRLSIDHAGESFDAPVYAALRALYFLHPPEERGSFAEKYSRSLDPAAQPLHAAAARAMLAGFRGELKAAQRELDRVLELRAVEPLALADDVQSPVRSWDFLLHAGMRLQGWRLDSLAEYLWTRALADPAWIQLEAQSRGELVKARAVDLRVKLTAVQLIRAEPWQFDEIFGEFSRKMTPDKVLELAETLEGSGANPRAIQIYLRLWEAEPANPHALRNLLNACRTSDDLQTLEQVLGRTIEDGIFRANDAAQRDLAFQLIELIEQRKDFAKGAALLGSLVQHAPQDMRVAFRLAQFHERAGQPALAERVYRRVLAIEPGNSSARLALATMLEAAGKLPAAIELLERGTGADLDSRLAQLYVHAGRLDEAVAALERVPVPGHVPATLAAANLLAQTGDTHAARLMVRAGLSRSSDLQTNFPLQSRLIELLAPQTDGALVRREMRRLRQMAADETGLIAACIDLLQRESIRLQCMPAFRRELAEAWADGGGDLLAGVAQLQSQLQSADPAAARTWKQLLARRDLDDFTVDRAATVFREAGDEAHEIEALAKLARLDGANPDRLIVWAHALDRQGRKREALKVVDELTARAVFHEDLTGRAAQTFAELGALDRARALFAEAVSADPTGRIGALHFDYARLLLRQTDLKEARQVLRTVFRNPAISDMEVLVAWLKAVGRLEEADAELASFALGGQRLLAARHAIFAELEQSGRARAALRMVEEHPEMLVQNFAARVRTAATGAELFTEGAALLERVVAQSPLNGSQTASELAVLYADWAEAELRSLQLDPALEHLKRAHQLRADLWPVAERLSGIYLDRGEPALAAQTLRAFLAASASTPDREKARQLLARIER